MRSTRYTHGSGIKVDLIRSIKRKTVAIQVRDGEVCVRAPAFVSHDEIDSIIDSKIHWIREKQQAQQLRESPPDYAYQSGEIFSYLGKNYHLHIQDGDKCTVALSDSRINVFVCHPRANVKKMLFDWYQTCAKSCLDERVAYFAGDIGVKPTSVIVKTYKARWGSCYSDGRISFNWKLILAPVSIIDYVVVHELCHLIEHNHSAKFWRLVAQHYPNYKAARDWLKHHGQRLDI